MERVRLTWALTADVGGFFGNPELEMLVRWYQVGAFAPFFRAHAHIDTKRREPYLLEEPYKSIVRDIIRLRYSLLPVWYTAFRFASVTGVPVLRQVLFYYCGTAPDLFYQTPVHRIPSRSQGLLDRRAILPRRLRFISPPCHSKRSYGDQGLPRRGYGACQQPGSVSRLTSVQPYYNYFSHALYRGSDSGKEITVPSDLHEIPLLIRGGHIVPTRERPRRASSLMKFDPFTLRVALDGSESATGDLYLDDGESYDHEKGNLVWRLFKTAKVSKKKLRVSSENYATRAAGADVVYGVANVPVAGDNAFAQSIAAVRVERIVIFGVADKPTKVTLENGATELEWDYEPGVGAKGKKEGTAGLLVIRDPAVRIVDDWSIEVDF